MANNPFINTEQVNAVIKVRRGPEVEREQYIYEDGELIYSTDKKRLFIGDGNEGQGTYGGNVVGNKIWYVDNFDKLNSIQKYDIVYRTDIKGEYLYCGNSYLLSSNYVLVGGLKLITDNVKIENYVLPNATKTVKGGVLVGKGLAATNGTLDLDYDPNAFSFTGNKLTLASVTPTTPSYATYASKGVVSIKDGSGGSGGLSITNGEVWANIDNSSITLDSSTNKLSVDSNVVMKAATTSKLGAVIVKDALTVDTAGNLKVKVDNNTIKIDGTNQLFVDTTVVGGAGTGGSGSSLKVQNAGVDLTGIDTLNIDTGLEATKSSSTANIAVKAATASTIGGVIIHNESGLTIDGSGSLSAKPDYTSITLNGAGQISLVDNYVTQLAYTAVDDALGGSSQAANGFVIIGEIGINWGSGTTGGGTSTTVTFASAFKSAPYSVTANVVGSTGIQAIGISSITASNCVLNMPTGASATINYIAIGSI